MVELVQATESAVETYSDRYSVSLCQLSVCSDGFSISQTWFSVGQSRFFIAPSRFFDAPSQSSIGSDGRLESTLCLHGSVLHKSDSILHQPESAHCVPEWVLHQSDSVSHQSETVLGVSEWVFHPSGTVFDVLVGCVCVCDCVGSRERFESVLCAAGSVRGTDWTRFSVDLGSGWAAELVQVTESVRGSESDRSIGSVL